MDALSSKQLSATETGHLNQKIEKSPEDLKVSHQWAKKKDEDYCVWEITNQKEVSEEVARAEYNFFS